MLRNVTRLLAAGDVWVAAVDGSNATRLTRGGGHVSPSQSDDGTIAVAKGDKVLLLDRAGGVRTTLDPPGVPDRRGITLDGPVADVALSPDGSKVAYRIAPGASEPDFSPAPPPAAPAPAPRAPQPPAPPVSQPKPPRSA